MNSRERVRLALNHKEPDRVPIDVGGNQSGISYETYIGIKQKLGIKTETKIMEIIQGLAKIDEEVLKLWNIDTRYVFQKPPYSFIDPFIKEDGYFIDKYGRRPIILIGVLGCSFFMLLMGLLEELAMEETAIYMLFLFLMTFGLTLGSVINSYVPEILPFKGVSATVMFSSAITLAIDFAVPAVYDWIGLAPFFFFFGFAQLMFFPYLYYNAKETKGMIPSEVDEIFNEGIDLD